MAVVVVLNKKIFHMILRVFEIDWAQQHLLVLTSRQSPRGYMITVCCRLNKLLQFYCNANQSGYSLSLSL